MKWDSWVAYIRNLRSKSVDRLILRPLIGSVAIFAIAALLLPTSHMALAQPDGVPVAEDVIKKSKCYECHSEPKLVKRLGDEQFKLITIDSGKFSASVHGALDCTACHKEFNYGFHADPVLNEEIKEEFERVFTNKSRSSQQALISCTECHQKEWTDYRESIHGRGLMEIGIADSPYCTDCHGKHYIKSDDNPTSATYLPNVPVVCAECHADEAVTLRYNLDKTVYSGYYESYHGKKQELGNAEVPVCTTCHTAHAIKAHDDPTSSVYGEAGERTCGECHTGADASFLLAFTHKEPTLESAPVVYIVRWFYTWILTLVILGMTGYIALDLLTQIRLRLRR